MDWIATCTRLVSGVVERHMFTADDYDAAEDYAKSIAKAHKRELQTLTASKPSSSYADGRRKETIYTANGNGSATLEIVAHEEPIIFVRASGWENEHCSCWSIEQAEVLYEALGRKIEEAKQIRMRYEGS